MAISFVKTHTVASNKTSGTTLALALSTSVPAGNLIVCRMVYDNASTASKPLISSIGKMAGETNNWSTAVGVNSTSTTAGSFASGGMAWIVTTVAWSAASYTVTLDTTCTQKAGAFQEFTGNVTATLRSTAGTNYSTTTTAASATTTGTAPVVGDLALGWIINSNIATVAAGDNDTTGGSWSTAVGIGSTGSTAATNNFGTAQYKVVTSTSHQTLNNSATMVAGNGAIVVVLQAGPDNRNVTSSLALNLGVSSDAVKVGGGGGGGGTTVTDNFNRAGPALGSNWGTYSGGTAWTISSNQALANTGVDAVSYWAANSFGPDQTVQVTRINRTNPGHCGLLLRYDPATQNGYYVLISSSGTSGPPYDDTVEIYKITGGSLGYLSGATTGAIVPAVPYPIKATVVGNTIQAFVNGVQVASVNDSTYASGPRIGLRATAWTPAVLFDDFTGGDIGGGPTVLSQQDWESYADGAFWTQSGWTLSYPIQVYAPGGVNKVAYPQFDNPVTTAVYEMGQADQTSRVQAKTSFNRTNGALVRYADANNYLVAAFFQSASRFRINIMQAGTLTTLAEFTTPSFSDEVFYWMEIRVVGLTVNAYWDNASTPSATATLTSGQAAALGTKAGFYLQNQANVAEVILSIPAASSGGGGGALTATLISSFVTNVGPPNPPQVTTSISPGANALLVCFVGMQDNGGNTLWLSPGDITLTSSGSGPTWTSKAAAANVTGAWGYGAGVWTAQTTSDPGSFTITITDIHAPAVGCATFVYAIYKVTGYDTTTPTGGKKAQSGNGNGAVALTLDAAPATNDITLAFTNSDSPSPSPPSATFAPGEGWTMDAGFPGEEWNLGNVGQRTGSTSTAVNWSDAAFNGWSNAQAAIVIKAAPAPSGGSWMVDFTDDPDGVPTGWTTVAHTEVGPATVISGVLRSPETWWQCEVRYDTPVTTTNLYAKAEYIYQLGVEDIQIWVTNADRSDRSGFTLAADGQTWWLNEGGGDIIAGGWTPPAVGTPFLIEFTWNAGVFTCKLNGTNILSYTLPGVTTPVYITTFFKGGTGLRKWSSGDVVAAPTLPVIEPFTYSNGELGSVSGGVWVRDTPSDSINVASGVAMNAGSGGHADYTHTTTMGSPDHYAEADVVVDWPDRVGLIIRCPDTTPGGNYYVVEVADYNGFNVYKVVGGTPTELTSGVVSLGGEVSGRLYFGVVGNALTVKWNTVTKWTGTDSTIATGNYVGIISQGATAGHDNFKADVATGGGGLIRNVTSTLALSIGVASADAKTATPTSSLPIAIGLASARDASVPAPTYAYNFNGSGNTAIDVMGNQNANLYTATATPGDIRSANGITFPTSATAAMIIPNVTPPTTAMSFSLKLTTFGSLPNGSLFTRMNANDTSGFNFFLNETLNLVVRTVAGPIIGIPATTLAINTTYQIAGTWNGTIVRLYKDGVQVYSSSDYSGALNFAGASPITWTIGYDPWAGSDGVLPVDSFAVDDVRYWGSTVLTPAEVALVAVTPVSDAPTGPTLLDNFNRADGALGSNWGTYSGGTPFTISGNQALGNVTIDPYSYWAANTFGADQEVQATRTNRYNNASLIARYDPVTQNGYMFTASASGGTGGGDDWVYLTKIVGGVRTDLIATVAYGIPAAPYPIKFTVVGSLLTGYVNGVEVISITDTTYTGGGRIGISATAWTPSATFDNFSGGTIGGASDDRNVTSTLALDIGLVSVPLFGGGGSPVADDFNRANAALTTPWVTIEGVHSVVSNKVPVGTASPTISKYNATFSNDQWAEADLADIAAGGGTTAIFPCVRVTSGGDLYYAWTTGDRHLQLWKRVGGTYTGLGQAPNVVAPNAKVRLDVEGTTLRLYADGVFQTSGTDSSITAGLPGIISANGGIATLDNWRGGDLGDNRNVTSALALNIGVSSTDTKTIDATSSLPTTIGVSSADAKTATPTSAVALSLGLASSDTKTADSPSPLPMAIGLASTAQVTSDKVVTSTLNITFDTSSIDTKVVPATSTLPVIIGVASTDAKTINSTATLPITVGLASADAKTIDSTSSLPLTVGLASDAVVPVVPQHDLWTFTQLDGPAVGWDAWGGANIQVVGNVATTLGSSSHYGAYDFGTVDQTADWELIFQGDALGATSSDPAHGLSVAPRFKYTGDGWGLYIGHNVGAGSMTWEIRDFTGMGETLDYVVVASDTGLPGSGWFRLAYDKSADELTAGWWNGSSFTTELTYDVDGHIPWVEGGESGGPVFIEMEQTGSTPVTVDNIYLSNILDAQLPELPDDPINVTSTLSLGIGISSADAKVGEATSPLPLSLAVASTAGSVHNTATALPINIGLTASGQTLADRSVTSTLSISTDVTSAVTSNIHNSAAALPLALGITSIDAKTGVAATALSFALDTTSTVSDRTHTGVSALPLNVGLASTGLVPQDKIETLVDPFVSTVNTTLWPDTSVAVVWEAGRAKIPVTTSYWALQTNLTAGKAYALTGSSVYARIAPPSFGNGSRSVSMTIFKNGSTPQNDKFWITTDGGTGFGVYSVTGGAAAVPIATGTYTNYLWWRIRESGGTVFFDTSPDGSAWTTFTSMAAPSWVNKVSFGFNAGYSGTETASDAFIDNVNIGVESREGSATASHTWTVTPATGKKTPKGQATTSHTWTMIPSTTTLVDEDFNDGVAGASINTTGYVSTNVGLGTLQFDGAGSIRTGGNGAFYAAAHRHTTPLNNSDCWAEMVVLQTASSASFAVDINVRSSAASFPGGLGGGYGLGVRNDGYYVYRANTPVGNFNAYTLPIGTPVTFRLEVIAGAIRVLINGVEAWTYTDSTPLYHGPYTGINITNTTQGDILIQRHRAGEIFTGQVVGKKYPKSAPAVTSHTWTIAPAVGVRPIIGVKQGTAFVTHTWTVTPATGTKQPKAQGTASHSWSISPATGKRFQKGSAVTGHHWFVSPAVGQIITGSSVNFSHTWTIFPTTGKKVPKGSAPLTHTWVPAAQGVRHPKAQAQTSFTFIVFRATGAAGTLGVIEAYWNGAYSETMQYGDQVVMEWMLVT